MKLKSIGGLVMSKKTVFIWLLVLALPMSLAAQTSTITGKITDAGTNDPLPGAQVTIQGTLMGAACDDQGEYTILSVPQGTYTLRASFVGFEVVSKSVTVTSETAMADFALAESFISGQTVTVFSSRAVERQTPVAFTTITSQAMEENLGSRDIPLILNTTPSVYATSTGGGAGDARLIVRGFDQRNIAIMINGVPQNDMENGWLYWSNWDGIADVTESIQMQRGLSATNLATPSIGGAMNIITSPTQFNKGFRYKQEFGNDRFLKSTLVLNSGLLNDRIAFTGAITKKTGKGLIDRTWTDAWAYYFGGTFQVNENNRLEVYGMGAPQRHGQNLYQQNIAAYSRSFAEDLDDYDPAALDKFSEVGRKYNENWGPVSSSYQGQQWLGEKAGDRYDSNFINERENFFHKPLVNLNWFSKLNDKLGLYSTLYYSGGRGGGTGTLGSLVWDYSGPSRFADWDATIARNDANADGSRGILRNSRNNQYTVGAISKAIVDVSDNLKLTGGLDWRTAEIDHFREVRDLLGGDYYRSTASDFWSEADQQRGLGDKVAYDFTNTVDWFGTFGQAEYSKDKLSVIGMVGYSFIKYGHTNHFLDDGSGNELTVETDRIGGAQVKGGASYRVSETTHVYGNLGFVSRVPIFDHVIDDGDGSKVADPKNQKFTSFEAGLNFRSLDGKYDVKISAYNTIWKDRSVTYSVVNQNNEDGLISLTGMNETYRGLELEVGFQPVRFVRFDGAASIANWKLTDDVSGTYKDYEGGSVNNEQFNFFVKDLRVGDAPQTQFALAGTVVPAEGLQGQLVFRHYREHYAAWDPFSRTDASDRTQSWKVPNYTVIDLHARYNLPVNFGGVNLQVFGHIFNLFDQEYIQDATDNSRFNGFDGDHDADDAEVFFGPQRFFNLGLTVSY